LGKQSLNNHYEHIIIGAGIVGSGIFRDLSLHGEDCLLVDRGDFNSQTSQSSSKMLHGGIRYLENFDFALVREALHEKKTWTKLAPHLTKEEMFIIPVYKESKWPLFFVRIGLFLYDLLSGFKNPRFKTLSKKKVLKLLPELKSHELKGAGMYSDAIVEDSKLGLECIYDALNEKCHALNYTQLIQVDKKNNYELTLFNVLKNEKFKITCNNVIFSLGPFTDQVLNQLNIPWENVIIPSKGSHIWLKQDALQIESPMVLQTSDQRIIFVIPQRNAILIGTTEIALDENEEMFNIQCSEKEIEYILNNINEYFPKAKITKNHIIRTFAGIRPLVKDGNKDRAKVSRSHKIFTPQKNMYVVCGGKYTTFRIMAQDVIKKIFKDSSKNYNKKLSLTPLRKRSKFAFESKNVTEEDIKTIIDNEMPQTVDDILYRRLSLINEEALDVSKDKIQNLLKSIE
jgi:glycerol-3-phosphate dehydrogenase